MTWLRKHDALTDALFYLIVIGSLVTGHLEVAAVLIIILGLVFIWGILTKDDRHLLDDMSGSRAFVAQLLRLPGPTGRILLCVICLVPVALGVAFLVDPNGGLGGGSAGGRQPVGGPDQELQTIVANGQELTTIHGDGYSIQMPGTLTHDEQTVRTPGGVERAATYLSSPYQGDFEFVAVTIPDAAAGSPDDAVRQAAAQLVALAADGTPTTYAGFPARDVVLPAPDADSGTTFLRVIRARTETFEIYLRVPGMVRRAPADYRRFLASLRITGPRP